MSEMVSKPQPPHTSRTSDGIRPGEDPLIIRNVDIRTCGDMKIFLSFEPYIRHETSTIRKKTGETTSDKREKATKPGRPETRVGAS